ncbi:molybdopterin-binding protein [Afifella sp. H1R]|uniref:molybdopterin-binding protein n=1 Tax=Afifella sp. H1R TaxID=2908841 RepID=UPI001F1F9882|nr:molybdopterin-binding protein [Afifella sp. H1R]MCF1503148.1 molybdopterin-binding protein [Afifella sp. H1R]
MTITLTRRGLIRAAAIGGGAALLSGCDRIVQNPMARAFLQRAEDLTMAAQRSLLDREALAREYSESEIIQPQRPNGSISPRDPDYREMAANGFADWRLSVTGLVERPQSLSLDELRAMPARTQITRHDCVEGWSCIAKWTGVPLTAVLDEAGIKPGGSYVVFRCADTLGREKYYESIDMIDARHPQTILAYGLNDETLPVANGAPLRVRIERQLGYKMAKYVMGIEVVGSFASIRGGKGGYWEDRGYEWYAGI